VTDSPPQLLLPSGPWYSHLDPVGDFSSSSRTRVEFSLPAASPSRRCGPPISPQQFPSLNSPPLPLIPASAHPGDTTASFDSSLHTLPSTTRNPALLLLLTVPLTAIPPPHSFSFESYRLILDSFAGRFALPPFLFRSFALLVGIFSPSRLFAFSDFGLITLITFWDVFPSPFGCFTLPGHALPSSRPTALPESYRLNSAQFPSFSRHFTLPMDVLPSFQMFCPPLSSPPSSSLGNSNPPLFTLLDDPFSLEHYELNYN
jgi:hypothetical protein